MEIPQKAKVFCYGAFGTLCLLLLRGLPPVQWVGHYPSRWGAIGSLFIVVGGILSMIWGDEDPFRAFYFGLTWIPLLAALAH